MVLPLVHIDCPVSGSSAYKTAGLDFPARSAALVFESPRNSPLDNANSTPSITSGGSGEIISLDVQPFSHASAPLLSTTFQAVSAVLAGARIQRTPAGSCQLVSAPVS